MTETLLDKLEESLRNALAYNANAKTAPVALLWPDRDRHFAAAAERLRSRLPLLTFGELDASRAQGPAYWLRCVIAGTVDAGLADGIPIVYLPGVGREDLRAVEECPRPLAPLAELQYRGQWFAHVNGKDWTVRALLVNRDGGLGLAVAEDAATGDALLGAFGELLDLPTRQLAAEYIDADFLNRLLNPDPIDALLRWLDDPHAFRERLSESRWMAFVEQSRHGYDFDPGTQGEVTGGRLLGQQAGSWGAGWKRFADNPERYPGVEQRLRSGKPQGDLFSRPGAAWPQDNEQGEQSLRERLLALDGVPAGQARSTVEALWTEHGERRGWVWATLGRAPLVFALEQLGRLADLTTGGPHGGVEDLASVYAEQGWKADDALLAALGAAEDPEDRRAVSAAATALYRPWVEAHARALQEAVGPLANAGTYRAGGEASTAAGTVTLFVDGLRLDLAHRLAARLGTLEVEIDTALAALPTVTQTAKPVLTPVPTGSLAPGDDLSPGRASSGAKANVNVLRGLMAEREVQVLQGSETGDPAGSAWAECGDIDRRGHDFGLDFVDELDRELDDIAKRVKVLLGAGWKQVDVVTDHGWLLLPGGLEKTELPAATVAVKKGRCARLKEGAQVEVPTVPWHWDPDVRIALAPGVSCFEANQEYEHGGVSPQECVVPRVRVRAAMTQAATGGAAITRLKWLGLMCRVELENVPPGATADIRALPANPSTSVAETVKETTGAGKQSLHVSDEELEGEPAYVVIVGRDGSILAQRETTIGANR
ncbi:MAG: BREX-1 system phosphatase PglZ type B [Longimicrobiaceae bacterium]